MIDDVSEQKLTYSKISKVKCVLIETNKEITDVWGKGMGFIFNIYKLGKCPKIIKEYFLSLNKQV